MIYLGMIVQSILMGVAVYVLCDLLADGAEDVMGRLLKCFRRKQVTLRHYLLQSGAIRKV